MTIHRSALVAKLRPASKSAPAKRLHRCIGLSLAVAGVLMLGACESTSTDIVAVSEPDPDLFFVRGYRSPDDACQLTGETEFTGEFLDHTADLVSCPTGDPAAETLVAETNARRVTQTNSYTLYSVQRM